MQTGHNARADRYTYLPQIGLYILMTWGGVELSASWPQRRKLLSLGAAAILTSLLAGAYVQTSYWKNSVTLWNRVLACKSGNAFAYYNLGSAMVTQGKWREAQTNFERALKIDPDYPDAEVNLGVALSGQGQREEATLHFQRALRQNPYSSRRRI
jgi:tetratricopeptide (TPR) repeat protein